MEVARRFTRRLHELPSEELELIAGLFVRREVHKGELLISEKDIARDIVFVEKGLLRQFYFKEGRDITENFACDGDIIQKRDFILSANLTMGFNKSRVDKINGDDKELWTTSSRWSSSDNDFCLKEGGEVGLIYGYVYDGIYGFDGFERSY